jgi:hypothetical protein
MSGKHSDFGIDRAETDVPRARRVDWCPIDEVARPFGARAMEGIELPRSADTGRAEGQFGESRRAGGDPVRTEGSHIDLRHALVGRYATPRLGASASGGVR